MWGATVLAEALSGPAAEGPALEAGLAESDQEGDVGQFQERIAQI